MEHGYRPDFRFLPNQSQVAKTVFKKVRSNKDRLEFHARYPPFVLVVNSEYLLTLTGEVTQIAELHHSIVIVACKWDVAAVNYCKRSKKLHCPLLTLRSTPPLSLPLHLMYYILLLTPFLTQTPPAWHSLQTSDAKL